MTEADSNGIGLTQEQIRVEKGDHVIQALSECQLYTQQNAEKNVLILMITQSINSLVPVPSVRASLPMDCRHRHSKRLELPLGGCSQPFSILLLCNNEHNNSRYEYYYYNWHPLYNHYSQGALVDLQL